MSMTIEPRMRYTTGEAAQMGDRVRTTGSREPCYLRVIGQRGYVTVYHPDWPVARVYHISEIELAESGGA